MEMLSAASVDTFKNLVWIVAVVIGLLFLIGSRVHTPSRIAARGLTAATAGTAAFAAANLAVVFYILAHLMDPRWSVGRDATVESPELSAGPFFQPVTDTLNDVLDGLAGSVNNVIAIKNASLTMPEFIFAAGWASLALVGLAVANRILSSIIEKEHMKQIDRNTRDLADIRAELGLSPFQDRKVRVR
ncbi:hypothetical protein AB0O54_06290 [Pseudarthrobacter oxydans]|uniref:hypothetical protein n=1 Tax=Pseudarthrobacter oxydans TaxID=1671 RepID=UPI00342AC779